MYNYDIIQRDLQTKYVGQTFIQFENLKSTHQKAKNISNNCPDGMLVLSENQEEFKIKNNKIWVPLDGNSIFMSLIFQTKAGKDYSSEIIQIANASVVKAIKEINVNIDVKIKWPNDIMIDNKKLCSTFCEYVGRKDSNSLILSIYINIIKDKFEDNNIIEFSDREDSNKYEKCKLDRNVDQEKTIALNEVYNGDLSKETLISNILNNLEIYYDELLKNKTICKALDVFKNNNVIINKFVGVKKINKKTVNIFYVNDINSKGQLVSIDNNKNICTLNKDEDVIEWWANDKKA